MLVAMPKQGRAAPTERSRNSPDARPPGALATTRPVANTGAESGSLRPWSETGAPGANHQPDQGDCF
jgi:hypothetical protein